jgi:hypothetical protein
LLGIEISNPRLPDIRRTANDARGAPRWTRPDEFRRNAYAYDLIGTAPADVVEDCVQGDLVAMEIGDERDAWHAASMPDAACQANSCQEGSSIPLRRLWRTRRTRHFCRNPTG